LNALLKALWEALMSKMTTFSILLGAALLAGCESIEEAKERDEALASPVNCSTAEGDLRILQGEKDHVEEQKAAGSATVAPASHVIAGVTGYSDQEQIEAQQPNIQMEVDRYQQAVDEKISKIKATCGL
jgi:outer membrane murein-binding lipoprotein Lpp